MYNTGIRNYQFKLAKGDDYARSEEGKDIRRTAEKDKS